MFELIKAAIVVILSLRRLLTSKRVKCVSLNNDPSLAWPTLINSNQDNLSYFLYMDNLDRLVEVVILLMIYLT